MADTNINLNLNLKGGQVVKNAFQDLSKGLDSISKGGQATNKSLSNIDSNLISLNKTSKVTSNLMSTLKTAFIGLAAGIGIKAVIDEAADLENALIGLTSVARSTGQNVDFITSKAKELASDGIIPLADVSATLKSLLASGLDAQKSIDVFEALRNAAAFNRQGQLSLAEAVKGASDGIKNQNSIMVDNAGITKNLSILVKEYASSVGKSVAQLSEQEKRMAIANGVIREARMFQGDYNRSLQTFTGALSAVKGNFRFLLADLGEVITKSPHVINSINLITEGIKYFREFVNKAKISINDFVNNGLTNAIKSFNISNAIISTVVTAFILLGKTVAINIGVAISALSKFIISLGLVSKAMTALKAVASLGLAIALDVLIFKVLEIKDEMGGFSGLLLRVKNDFLTFFNFLKIKFEEIKISAIEFVNYGLGSIVNGLSKVTELFGKKIEFSGFDLGLQESLDNISKINDETDRLQQEITDTIDKSTREQAEKIRSNLEAGYNDAINKMKEKAKDQIEQKVVVVPQVDRKAIEEAFKAASANPFEVLFKAVFSKEALAGIKKDFEALKISIDPKISATLLGAAAGISKSLISGGKTFLTTFIKSAGKFAEKIVGPLGSILADLLSSIIETFGIDPALFKDMIVQTFSDLPEIIGNTIYNLVALTSGKLVSDMVEGFINNIPILVERLTESLVTQLASPFYWTRIAVVAVSAFIRSIPEIIQGFINGFRNGFDDIFKSFNKAGKYIEEAGKIFSKVPEFITGAAKSFVSFIKNGAVNFVSKIIEGAGKFIEQLIKKIPGVGNILGGSGGGGIIGTVTGAIGSIGSALGFAEGGYVPPGYPNDTFPARLTSGEFVIDRTLANKLSEYIDSNNNKTINSGITDNLLVRVIDLLERPLNTSATVELDNREFAKILLQMDRTNQRIAI